MEENYKLVRLFSQAEIAKAVVPPLQKARMWSVWYFKRGLSMKLNYT